MRYRSVPFFAVCMVTGIGGVWFVPGLGILTFTIGVEATSAYSINQSSKDVLYVPLDAISTYKGKAFIYIFGIRAAKALGATILLACTPWLRSLGVPPATPIVMALVLIVIWLYSLRKISAEFENKTAEEQRGRK